MKINRIKKDKDFVILSTIALKDNNLSWGAKGLHSFIMQLPDEWELNVEGLKAFSTVGRDGTASLIKELMAAGYIQRKKVKNERNQFLGYEYDIYESPQPVNVSADYVEAVNGKAVNGSTVNGETDTIKYEDNTIVLSNEKLNNINSPVFEKTEQLVFSKAQILAWQRPENLPEQLFKTLQDFAIERQGRAKKERMTERAWGIILKQAQTALTEYNEKRIIEHIESGMVGNWKSPFWKGWEATMTKDVMPEQSQPLPDSEKEQKYQKTIAWILKRFEYIADSKVRQINREEWLDIFDSSGQSFKQFQNYFTDKQKFFIFEQVLTRLATDNYVKKSTLYSHLLKALKDEKAAKVKQRS